MKIRTVIKQLHSLFTKYIFVCTVNVYCHGAGARKYKYLKSYWAAVKSVAKKNGGFMWVAKYINNYEMIKKKQHSHISYVMLIIIQ